MEYINDRLARIAQTLGQNEDDNALERVRTQVETGSGEPVETALVGVFDITKVGSQAWTVGAKVYWDDTNKRCTTVATDNTLIGVAVEAVASGASDTIGRVRLNAAF